MLVVAVVVLVFVFEAREEACQPQNRKTSEDKMGRLDSRELTPPPTVTASTGSALVHSGFRFGCAAL